MAFITLSINPPPLLCIGVALLFSVTRRLVACYVVIHSLTFQTLKVYVMCSNCPPNNLHFTCDFVELTDVAGWTIRKYSGLKSAFVVGMFGNMVQLVNVKFASDSSVRRPGFLAYYSIISGEYMYTFFDVID